MTVELVHRGTDLKPRTQALLKVPATRRVVLSSTEKTKKMVTCPLPKSVKVCSFSALTYDRDPMPWLMEYLGSEKEQMVSMNDRNVEIQSR